MRPVLLLALFAAACAPPSNAPDLRAERDLVLGRYENDHLRFVSERGLLHVRRAGETSLELRANSSELSFDLERKDATSEVQLLIANLGPDVELVGSAGALSADGAPVRGVAEPNRPKTFRWTVRFPAGVDRVHVQRLPPPPGPFTFLTFGDIQNGISRFGDVVAKVNEEPDAEFIVVVGDLSQRSSAEEFERVEAAFDQIRIPLWVTLGNHDVSVPGEYQDRFGLANWSATHRGARFTTIDSGAATIAERAFTGLEGHLDEGADQLHVFFTHIPAVEKLGLRSGQWNSRREAHRFVSLAVEHDVDLILYGHLHTYDEYETGGIPTFISGGCGAIEERFDGIDRHFLRIQADPAAQTTAVEVRRVE